MACEPLDLRLKRRRAATACLLNIVAHKAMLSAYGKGKKTVGAFDVLSALGDTASLRGQPLAGRQGVLLLILLGSCLAAAVWVYRL